MVTVSRYLLLTLSFFSCPGTSVTPVLDSVILSHIFLNNSSFFPDLILIIFLTGKHLLTYFKDLWLVLSLSNLLLKPSQIIFHFSYCIFQFYNLPVFIDPISLVRFLICSHWMKYFPFIIWTIFSLNFCNFTLEYLFSKFKMWVILGRC